MDKGKRKAVCEWAVVLAGIAIGVGMFSIPTIIFYVYRDNNIGGWRESIAQINSQLLDCYNETEVVSTNFLQKKNQSISRRCMKYDSTKECHTSLQGILTKRGLSTHNLTVEMTGKDLSQIENVLQLLLSFPLLTESCREKGLPLYCQFLFPPCTHNDTLHLTRSKCIELKSKHCKTEIDFLNGFRNTPLYKRFSFLDPNCTVLPQGANHSFVLKQPNHTEMLAASPSNESVATSCHPEFTSVCSLCLPSCTDLYYNTRIGKGLQIDDAAKILASCFAVFGAVVFIVLALLKWKDVFTFPTILVFYQNIIELMIGVLILLPFVIGRGVLFCSYDDIVRTLHNPPTPFCSFSGVIFHFGVTSFLVLWLMHLGYITVLISFPIFGERKLTKWSRKIHAIFIFAAFLLCTIGPVVILSTIGYVPIRFPPSVCYPSSMDAVFYSLALPDCIILCTGVIMMIITVRNIHKGLQSNANDLKNKLNNTRSFFSVPEIKLIIISVMIVILGTIVMGTLTYTMATQGEYSRAIITYSTCQLYGDNPACAGRDEDMRISKTTVNTIAFFALGLMPYINIFFILKLSDVNKARRFVMLLPKRVKHQCLPNKG
jgi:hypothetical protein